MAAWVCLCCCTQVYDLGREGMSLAKVAQIGLSEIARYTLSVLHTSDTTLVQSLVSLSVLPRSESSTLHLLAITTAGVYTQTLSLLYVHGSVFYPLGRRGIFTFPSHFSYLLTTCYKSSTPQTEKEFP